MVMENDRARGSTGKSTGLHCRCSSGLRECPTCKSPRPRLHPAVQFEGEVQPCADAFHLGEDLGGEVEPIRFTCPRCERSHARGYLDGVSLFRCLGCGYVGHGHHPDEEIDREVQREIDASKAEVR